MLQGVSSNAGKSVLVTALCRILLQDGIAVAPFKSQNMALNSFVTPDGLEIGRAQAVQAAACRMEPDVRMNPVLLKPSSDVGSQVVIMGKPVGNMRVREYMEYKPTAFQAACAAYDSLAGEHEVMVLEGAGSPAEINLKAHDIVNMRMAEYAKAQVLLVGDIDRGGVFASLVGTMELLDPWERRLVAGLVINRFRGDATLLDSALTFTTQRTGKPFLGVVPYVPALGLPEEDSVSFKDAMGAGTRYRGAGQPDGPSLSAESKPGGKAFVDVAVIDLPHIANFTDLDALTGEPDVWVRGVRSVGELGTPDCVILPGSKNTLGDLAWLRETGLAAALQEMADSPHAPEIVGICGGLQMLGRTVDDPEHVETDGQHGSNQGLRLLDVCTVMGGEKILTRVRGEWQGMGTVCGYEIHHGRTQVTDAGRTVACVRLDDGSVSGFARVGLLVWGTYMHGIFDADPFRRAFVDRLRVRRGLAPLGRVVAPYSLEPALDRLADAVRHALDMDAVYRLLGR